MFDNLMQEDLKQTGVDALLKLIDHKDVDRITDYEMAQIRVLTIAKWHYYLQTYPEKKAIEILNMTLDYYKELKVSYKRKGRQEIVKGVSEMKEALLEHGLINPEARSK